MHFTRTAATLTAALALAVVGACSSSTTDTPASNTAASNTSEVSSPAPDAQAHNDADMAFARNMIPHHQQAIEMSDMLLAKQGVDPRVVSLAKEIKAAQGPEITQMQGWLRQWGQPAAPNSPGDMPAMPGHDMSGDAEMPGMAHGEGMMSDQDMAALQNAEGATATRLFLTQMIEHHQGAVEMAETEVQSGQYAPAVNLARLIESLQQQEIATMEKILQSL